MERTVEIPGEARRLLSEIVTTRMRQLCGKGPLAVKVRTAGDVVTIEVDGFMTPYEETLARDEANAALVAQMREKLLGQVTQEYQEVFREHFGLRVLEIFGDVDVKRNRRTITIKVT